MIYWAHFSVQKTKRFSPYYSQLIKKKERNSQSSLKKNQNKIVHKMIVYTKIQIQTSVHEKIICCCLLIKIKIKVNKTLVYHDSQRGALLMLLCLVLLKDAIKERCELFSSLHHPNQSLLKLTVCLNNHYLLCTHLTHSIFSANFNSVCTTFAANFFCC